MLLVFDNAESILDPQGPNAQEIYAVVDELTRLSNICLCITSRISITPPRCKTLEIPTLATEAAKDVFYRIYKQGERPDAINNILDQLDSHPLSITLLATVGQRNKWGTDRLAKEWEKRRTGVLDVQGAKNFASTIELSLASPMFQGLGTDARSLLEVVAFFPQGVNERNLFPTISGAQNILDTFCILSLAYQYNGFVTMLAPLRDYLRPKDPASSSLLGAIKERYFARLSGSVIPGQLGFEKARWIITEDANVEHLLEVFTTIEGDSESVWTACSGFMNRLYWHKPRLVMLGPMIEALPDNHPSKVQCLWDLSRLFKSVGNFVEQKRLLTHILKLWGEVGNRGNVALTLRDLSNANRRMGLHEEGIQQAKEACEICERAGDVLMQAECLINLASLFRKGGQLDAAEEAALRAINLIPEEGQEFRLCELQTVLGDISSDKGEVEKAIHHFEMALEIAASLQWQDVQFWNQISLSQVFSAQGKFEDAQVHLELAEMYTVNNTYLLAHAVQQQALFWDQRGKLQAAESEALRALDAFEKLGATNDAEVTRQLLHRIEAQALKAPHDQNRDGKPLETIPLVHCVDSSCSDRIVEFE